MKKRSGALLVVFLTITLANPTMHGMGKFSRYAPAIAKPTHNNARIFLVGCTSAIVGITVHAAIQKKSPPETPKVPLFNTFIDKEAANLVQTEINASGPDSIAPVVESIIKKGEIDIEVVRSLGKQLPFMIRVALAKLPTREDHHIKTCLAVLGAVRKGSDKGDKLVGNIIGSNTDLILEYLEKIFVTDYVNNDENDGYNHYKAVLYTTHRFNDRESNFDEYLYPLMDILDDALRARSPEKTKRQSILADALTKMRIEKYCTRHCPWNLRNGVPTNEEYWKYPTLYSCRDFPAIKLVTNNRNQL